MKSPSIIPYTTKKKRYPFKISADNKSCTFLIEMTDATEKVCLSEQNLPNNPIEGHTYTTLGQSNNDKFLECFKNLFN